MLIVPHHAWAMSLKDSKKSGRPHRLGGGGVPCRSPTVIPTAIHYILYTTQASLNGGNEYSILTASMADMQKNQGVKCSVKPSNLCISDLLTAENFVLQPVRGYYKSVLVCCTQ